MIKSKNYFSIIKLITCIIIFISMYIITYIEYSNNYIVMISCFSLITIIVVNAYLITLKAKYSKKIFYVLLFVNICISSALQYFLPGISTSIYNYILLTDIFKEKNRIIKLFLSIHFILFFTTLYFAILKRNEVTIYILLVMMGILLLSYLGISGMLYSIRTLEIEKEEVKQLNTKLKFANIKLQEYALTIEEVATSRERTRVAQELHDSLGHSLMALAMHLEFAKKICTTKPQKVEEVLAQSEKIAKSSINDLRKAVTVLNSEVEVINFNEAIKKLIDNFYLFSNIQITFTKNEEIEALSPIIKTSLYKTIQESITNSLKHGNATEINIKTKKINQDLELTVTDNGIGCNNIVKSNGLNGIENRITALGGSTYYFSHNGLGFGLKISIPI
ncbi:sensor histidine kinase [Clostridium saccharoperbutylacetonicum]|uniref:sensor histidine kinase n=2 Tax=Clostridium saccharoperbutylacetonicum TaxID=36745 RepID=UPI000983B334|nr:sensor histidine kinase [Clostridium saccharoperbutylacetonicum]AQR97183.1 sensor histidine kinase DesK [Clostridium saccharoperbutylacetonicum]